MGKRTAYEFNLGEIASLARDHAPASIIRRPVGDTQVQLLIEAVLAVAERIEALVEVLRDEQEL